MGCTSGDLFGFKCPKENLGAREYSRHPDPEGQLFNYTRIFPLIDQVQSETIVSFYLQIANFSICALRVKLVVMVVELEMFLILSHFLVFGRSICYRHLF